MMNPAKSPVVMNQEHKQHRYNKKLKWHAAGDRNSANRQILTKHIFFIWKYYWI